MKRSEEGVQGGEERGGEERRGVKDVIRKVVSRHTRVKTKTQKVIRLRSAFGFEIILKTVYLEKNCIIF